MVPPSNLPATTSKTPHRRRRKIKAVSNDGQKENTRNASNVKAIFASDEKETVVLAPRNRADQQRRVKHHTGDGSNNASSFIVNSALHLFQESQAKTESAPFWRSESGLADSVVQGSFLLSLASQGIKTPSCLRRVRNNASPLLSQSRKLIKAVSESKDKSQQRSATFPALLVAVHTIRAVVAATFSESNTADRIETCLRLLYHLLAIATESVETNTKLSMEGTEWRLSLIALAGYEALGATFVQYHCSLSSGQRVKFKRAAWSGGAYPVWCAERDTTTRNNGSMTLRQLSTMAFRSAHSVTSTMYKLWWYSEDEQNGQDVSNEAALYGDVARTLTNQNNTPSSDNTHLQPVKLKIKFMAEVCLPWLIFIADSLDAECAKDWPALSKSSNRTLWDAASKLKQEKVGKISTRTLETASLQLRQHAVSMLIPEVNTPAGKELVCKHVETACAQAWKAASAYAQTMLRDNYWHSGDHALQSLHEFLGPKIDCFAFHEGNTSLPLSYVEYTVYRSIHCGIGTGLHSSEIQSCWINDFPENHASAKKGQFLSVLLRVLLLGVRARLKLEDEDPSAPLVDGDSTHILFDHVSQLEHLFGESALVEFNELPDLIRSRVFKLVSTLSLHRTIFKATKERKWAGKEADLELASILLVKFIGPLTWRVIQLSKDSSHAKALYDAALECYIRPVAAFERLSEPCLGEENERLHMMSNAAMDEVCPELLRNSRVAPPPPGVVEKCAKSFSVVARQRADTSTQEESLVPLLWSLRLYSSLASTPTEFQLSTRLSFLANALQSLGRNSEAALVLCATISNEIPLSYGTAFSSISGDRLLWHLGSRTKHVLVPENCRAKEELTVIAKSSIRQLGKLLLSEKQLVQAQLGDDPHGFSIPMALDIVLGSVQKREEAKTEPISVLCVLGAMIENIFRENGAANLRETVAMAKLLTLVDVMVEVCDVIHHTNTRGASIGMQPLQVLGAQIGQVIPELPFNQRVLSALVDMVAGISLLSVESGHEKRAHSTVFELSQSYTTAAYERLTLGQEDDPDSDGTAFFTAVFRASLTHFLVSLNGTPRQEQLLEVWGECQFAVNLAHLADDTTEFARSCLLWTLSQHETQWEAFGDSCRSFDVACWILDLLDKTKDEDSIRWYQSVATAAYLRCSQPSDAFEAVVTNNLANELNGPLSESFLCTAEAHLSRIRVLNQASYAKQMDLSSEPGSELQQLIGVIETEMPALSGPMQLLYMWLLSSIHLTLAELAMTSNHLVRSLQHTQLCSQYSQSVSAASSRAGPRLGAVAPFWICAALSTITARARQRFAMTLRVRLRLYCQLGDHRKAESYLKTLAEVDDVPFVPVDRQVGPDLNSLLVSAQSCTSSQRSLRRLTAELRCHSSSVDLVVQGLVRLPPSQFRHNQDAKQRNDMVSWDYGQSARDLFTVGDIIYGGCVFSGIQKAFQEYYAEAFSWARGYGTISSMAMLREVRCLLSSTEGPDTLQESRMRSLCLEITQIAPRKSMDRAWAYYYLGVIESNAARRSGALTRMWAGAKPLEEHHENCLSRAREFFLDAARHRGCLGSDSFSRFILRSLALVSGPESGEPSGLSSGVLVLSSIGQSYRQLMFRSLAENGGGDAVQPLLMAFGAFDNHRLNSSERDSNIKEFFEHFSAMTPEYWKYVAATICPSGEVLLTSVEKPTDGSNLTVNTTCVFPLGDHANAYDDILAPLDEIILESQNQLCGMDVAAVTERFNKEEAKRKWWDDRHQLDSRLRTLLQLAEESYFASLDKLDGTQESIFADKEPHGCTTGNLSSRFEAAAVEETTDISEQALKKLTVPKLKARLRDDYGFVDSETRKLRKQELINLLIETELKHREQTHSAQNPGKGCLFLILDENLHRFPLENIPSLDGNTVCRVPSLPFVYASLFEHSLNKSLSPTPLVDPPRTRFVLDPEENLLATRNRLVDVLDSIASRQNWEWESVVGRTPPASFIERGLQEDSGLVMYFGHGGGQRCFSRRQVEGMICPNSADFRTCRATVILMGCSSGRLVSVNRKFSRAEKQIPLHYEPEGIALSYLCAGAPCVVGNLWDVTDHDIDRFSTALLDDFFSGESSLSSCIATSRGACKLRYIVGCAPVCYGVPVHLLK